MLTSNMEYSIFALKYKVMPIVCIGKNDYLYELFSDILEEYTGNNSLIVATGNDLMKKYKDITNCKLDEEKISQKNREKITKIEELKEMILKEE